MKYSTLTLIAAFLSVTGAAVEDQQIRVRSGLKHGKATAVNFRQHLQQEIVARSTAPKNAKVKTAKEGIMMEDEFWQQHGSEFGVTKDDMRPIRTFTDHVTGNTYTHFQQKLLGHDVFAGRMVLTTGPYTGRVLRAQGHTMDKSFVPKEQKIENGIAHATISAADAKANIAKYLMANHNADEATAEGFTEDSAMSLVWHRMEASSGRTGKVALVYHVSGSIREKETATDIAANAATKESLGVNRSGGVLNVAFDAFVDAADGSMFKFIDKTSQFISAASLDRQKQLKAKQDKKQLRGPSATAGKTALAASSVVHTAAAAPAITFDTPFPFLNVFQYDISDGDIFYDQQGPNSAFPTSDAYMNNAAATTVELDNMYQSSTQSAFKSYRAGANGLYKEYLNRPNYANAYYWNNEIVFGEGLVHDDVLGHEWTHGLVEYTCGLIYEYESGALNEAFADMFGETIDLKNYGQSYDSTNTASPDREPAGYEQNARTAYPRSCSNYDWSYGYQGTDNSYRWVIGQYAFGGIDGAIRDMYYPECFNAPSDVWSSSYYCGTGDYGGVHINSGIPNRIFALLVDGGSYEDQLQNNALVTVDSVGFDKAIYLMNQMLNLLGPSSGFEEFGNGLNDVCEAAVGSTPFRALIQNVAGVPSASGAFTQSDCDNVAKAVAGSGMTQPELLCGLSLGPVDAGNGPVTW